ncbi:glycosyltransferase [Dongia soli]|uniref:Glycosyltransferase n=1 Tax=Dongia soli TaxID=600628 RepID=A0ABU5E5Y8_9PROT|nr:glycosyltransferase [Dongia soli]MDY0881564.1 glycosyltransferase [Dongia soli]
MTKCDRAVRNSALRVAVLVTLERGDTAGGHVKCWERFAEAAIHLPEELDLTVHFLGKTSRVEHLARHVRLSEHPAVFSTRRLRFLDQGAGHTDLAPFHPAVAAALADSDVVHATDFFSFGRSAMSYARRHGSGLTASIHTDIPQFTRIYASAIFRRMAGMRLGGMLSDRLHLQDYIAARLSRAIDERLHRCHQVLASKPEDYQRLLASLEPNRLALLRRGIDRERFAPRHRDRARLQQLYGIPAGRPVLMFAGRVDASKSAMVVAETARQLVQAGEDIQLLVVGDGEDSGRIAALLGERVCLPGHVSQETLAWLYASADLFLFPSTTEVSPNVVLEAKASGLPVLVAASHGGAQFISRPGTDGFVLASQNPADWVSIAEPLLQEPARRHSVGRAARAWIDASWPSWIEVLRSDLLPAWQRAAQMAYRDHAVRDITPHDESMAA